MTLSAESPRSALSTPRALARLIPFAKPVLPRLILGAVSALFASLLALTIPLILEVIVAGPIASGDITQIAWGSALILVLGLAEALMVWLRRWFVLGPATQVEYDLRRTFYARLQRLPVSFHDRWQSGQLLSRMMQDISLIRRWLAFGVVLLVVNVLTIVVGSALLFRWHWLLGTIFLVTSAPLWFAGYRFEKTYGALARQSQDQAGDLATSVEESVHGIRVLKAFGRGKHALQKFTTQAETLRQTELRKAGAVGRIWFWLVLLPEVAFALCLGAGIWLVQLGQLRPRSSSRSSRWRPCCAGRWSRSGSCSRSCSTPAPRRTASSRSSTRRTRSSIPTAPRHRHAARRTRVRGRALPLPGCADRERDLLDGIDLVLRPGETMALVGLTGSGKTTLTTLPTRLYDVTAGRVTLDGVDVRDLELSELRTHIAMAFEDATLFSQSVRENVLLGRADLEPAAPRRRP